MSLLGIAWRNIKQRAFTSGLTALSMSLGVALVVATLITGGVVKQAFESGGPWLQHDRWAKAARYNLCSIVFILPQQANREIFRGLHMQNFCLPMNVRWKDGTWAASTQTAVPICMVITFVATE